MAILLVRHGETGHNAARILQPPDTPLGVRGRAQAEALAQRLAAAPWRIGAVLSSDLPRAWQTAQAVAARFALPIEPSALLHERNFGALRGRPYDGLGYDPLVMEAAPPGGESGAAFAERARMAFALMLQRHAALDAVDLLVLTHGLLIRALLAGPLKRPAAEMQGLQLANTSITRFDATPPHDVLLLNCTRHLDDKLDALGLSGG